MPLPSLTGTWTGAGVNHESQPFTAHLTIHPINSTAFILTFTATGTDGEIYHTETILISETSATSASNNLPGLATFTVTRPNPETLTLTLGDLTNETAFRETITLHSPTPDTLHNTYAWAMPGEPLRPSSTSHLTRTLQLSLRA
jgi:hypothetical protein